MKNPQVPDPGFHRAEVELRLNRRGKNAGNPYEPDMIVIDHDAGVMIRLPVDSLPGLVDAIGAFLKTLEDANG